MPNTRKKTSKKSADTAVPKAETPAAVSVEPAMPKEVPVVPIAEPTPCMPDSPEALINNVLCREIVAPSKNSQNDTDPNIALLDHLAKGLTAGTDLNPIKDDVLRVASHQPEKINVIKAMLLGIDLNRVARFAQVRDKAERELARAANRGDLTSTEYLAFLRFSSSELKDIYTRLNPTDVAKSSGSSTDSQALLDRLDKAKQAMEIEQAKQFEGTTPQGMELVRKQVFKIKKKLKKAGKLKPKQSASAK